jgi:nickel-dependent lactate racemase
MTLISIPYGKGIMSHHIPDERIKDYLVSGIHKYKTDKSQTELVREAMDNPTGSPKLRELAKGKKRVTIIASDHTRPVPSKLIIPLMLEEIRRGNPDAEVTILIATGCHRATTKEELISKFGEEIVAKEHIHIHDCDDEKNLVNIGVLPSGGECIISRIAYDADLLVAEGFIEPHFFAGFSGGRKSVMPGVASRLSVLANHCSEFINDEHSRTGNLKGNPIHRDMIWAARKAGLKFICNVVINSEKQVIYAVSGDMEAAHEKGCEFLGRLCRVKARPSDIVITSNGGYPLDQNIYQAVKGMTAAEAAVKKGGVIIMAARSGDGHGGESFFRQVSEERDISRAIYKILARGRNETISDQWEAQIFFRVLSRTKVIYISDAPDELVKSLHMIPAHSLGEAIEKAESILGNPDASISVIPDGVSVIAE